MARHVDCSIAAEAAKIAKGKQARAGREKHLALQTE
jgi:hypothetical protein